MLRLGLITRKNDRVLETSVSLLSRLEIHLIVQFLGKILSLATLLRIFIFVCKTKDNSSFDCGEVSVITSPCENKTISNEHVHARQVLYHFAAFLFL